MKQVVVVHNSPVMLLGVFSDVQKKRFIWELYWNRVDGPAIIHRNKEKLWYQDDLNHNNYGNVIRISPRGEKVFSSSFVQWCTERVIDEEDPNENDNLIFKLEYGKFDE